MRRDDDTIRHFASQFVPDEVFDRDSHGVRDDAFEDWLRGERNRLHNLAIDLLDQLAASQSGNSAIETAQRLLQLDPAAGLGTCVKYH